MEGKNTYTFALHDGREVQGSDLQQPSEWTWRESLHVPGVRYAWLRPTSPTYGALTLILVLELGVAQYYLRCLATYISRPRLILAWKRRQWIERCFSDLEALAGNWGLSEAQRGGVIRPPVHTPHGVLGVVVYLRGHLQRAAHDGGDTLQSQTLLALCGLRSS